MKYFLWLLGDQTLLIELQVILFKVAFASQIKVGNKKVTNEAKDIKCYQFVH